MLLLPILWKNLIIRRRHWMLTISEVLLPILLFLLVAYGRSHVDGLTKVNITETTYHDAVTKDTLEMHLPVGEMKLWYSPYTDFTDKIIKNVQERFQIPGGDIKEFTSEEKLLKYFTKNPNESVIAVNFKHDNLMKLNYDIGIHKKYLTWDTGKFFAPLIQDRKSENGESTKYLYEGFTAMQFAINMAFIEISQETPSDVNIDFFVQEFPYPPHTLDSGLNRLFMEFLPLITIISFIVLFPAVLTRVGEEKYSGAKELLKMVGVRSFTIWLGWIIHALCTNIISIVIIVILMKVPIGSVSYAPIEHSNWMVLFVFLLLYCLAAITFCFLMATIFHKPGVATLIGIAIWILSYIIPQTLVSPENDNISWYYKILLTTLPNIALKYGYSAIAAYEIRDIGIQLNNLFESGTGEENDLTMAQVFLILAIDTVLFMICTLLIENVKSGKYSIAASGFPWFGTSRIFQNSKYRPICNISDPEIAAPVIAIKSLYKKYDGGYVVENLTLDIYKNCITILLGHNGAGKSTFISMLTGMIRATKGTIELNGQNIERCNTLREKIGYCPQDNLLFSDLTVVEHLEFFAKLRRVAKDKIKINTLLKGLGISQEDKNKMAVNLSGGNKRKLCLGMALTGDLEVLILDEPTSGLDPTSRRKVWNLLEEHKQTKAILITTHFMEEADALGDKIAIMAHGRLQCYDTPLRLREKYNIGYHFSLMLDSDASVENITCKINNVLSEATLLRQNGNNVVYLFKSDEKHLYSSLIQALEEEKLRLGILTMALSITTLNDIYLKVQDESKNNVSEVPTQQPCNTNASEVSKFYKEKPRKYSAALIITALLNKRWLFLKRNIYSYIPAPVLFLLIFILTMRLELADVDFYKYNSGELNLNLKIYGRTEVLYGGSNSPTNSTIINKIEQAYYNSVLGEIGVPVKVEHTSKAIVQNGISNIAYYKKHMVVAAEFNESDLNPNEIIVNAMYSSETLHSLPISVNLAMNAIAKTLLNDSFSITTTNKPLKLLYTDFAPSELSEIRVGVLWLLLIPIAMLFFMSTFLIFPNSELSTNFIRIQLTAGVKMWMYWLTNIIFDYIVVCLPKLCVTYYIVWTINVLIFDSKILGTEEFHILAIIFLSHTFGSLPFVYLFSHAKTIFDGFKLLIMCGIFLGIFLTVAVRALELSGDNHYINAGNYLKHFLLYTSPHFAFTYICVKFAQKYVENFNWTYMNPNKKRYICDTDPIPCCKDEFTVECQNYKSYMKNEKFGVQNDIEEMMISFILYLALLCFLHSEIYKIILSKLSHLQQHVIKIDCCTEQNDESIEQRINEKEDRLFVSNLNRSFGIKTAVRGLKLALKKNQCFGLLGVNGAGKSTAFKILTKDIVQEKGKVTMLPTESKKIDISHSEYSKSLGYCPQENSLNYSLTGRELLQFIARIRGYSWNNSFILSDILLKEFDLLKDADKLCLVYSGGNKRKLCSSIAFLGCPPVIFLDEPTSGVDPSSRRNFWNNLSKFKKTENTSILLCSHNMEECEALCDRIGIMKDGRIVDEGSLFDLKKTYVKGYTVVIKPKCAIEADDFFDQHSTILRNANSKKVIKTSSGTDQTKHHANEKEMNIALVMYQISNENVRLSVLFDELERLKTNLRDYIDDYTVTQNSLEDIFLSVAETK